MPQHAGVANTVTKTNDREAPITASKGSMTSLSIQGTIINIILRKIVISCYIIVHNIIDLIPTRWLSSV